MAWTTEQQRAIDARGNLIVSAAAGAGKTAVLTERVARLVEQGASMDRMLILTFTRAAAGEMKGRIEDRLLLLAREAAGEVQKRLRRQALLCRSAQISTIHAFCARVVNRHFHMAELSPGVTTLDETESAVLMEQAAAEALLLFAREKEEAYQTLLRAFDREEKVLEGLLKLHGFLCAQPDRERWLAQTRESLFSGEALQKAGELCMQEGKRRLHLAAKDLQEYLPLIDCQYGKVIAYMQGVLESTERALAAADFYAYTDALEQIPFGVLRFPKTIEAEEKNRIVELRDRLKKCVNDQILLFFRDREQEQAVQNQSAKGLQALFDLWEAFDRAYTQKKKDRDRIDFNDQEHYCARILSDERVAREYRERFDYIIVDEYQDSNRVQEAILQRICREDNLFFVGDVKQSIYGFRMAEPGLFLEKLSSFTGAAGQRVDLNCNFRSSQAVLDAVNSVFEKLMGPGMGDILYDETAALKPGRSQPEGLAELHLIEGEDDPQGEPLDSPEAEARFCAEKIRSIMKEERLCLPGGDERPYAYSDFAILLRSTGQARVFARTLALCGVPCYAQLTGGYFESIEVAVFLNLLRIIDNRRQDIPLLSVLRSAMGGFSDEALIGLRSRCPQGEYLDCLLLEAQRETQAQAAAFLERLERYRQMSLLLPVEELVSRLLDDTGFYREMGAMPGGRQRQSNLDALVEKARAYDGTGAFGLRGFLKYMDMARDSDKAGAAQSVTADAVRILSIHKSKGLEFPVVFLCDLGRRFNRRDEQESLLLDGDWGAALSFVDKDRVKRVPLLYKAIRLLGRQRQIEEEMRVLYVAMTRPKGRLYMVGSRKNAEVWVRETPPCTPWALYEGDTPLRWLLLTLRGRVPLCIHGKEEFAPPPKAQAPLLPQGDPQLVEKLAERYAWQYPFAEATGLPHKTSVTALSHREEETPVFDPPPFAQEQDNPLVHGTLIHALLQHISLHPGPGDWEQAMTGLSARDRRAMEWFLSSPLFRRMQASADCRRELPFTLAARADTLPGMEGAAPEERVLLQGVIDACFREKDGWVLLDYKTDRLRDQPAAAAAEKHRRQVELYASVLRNLTGIPVKEKYIVFLTEKEVAAL